MRRAKKSRGLVLTRCGIDSFLKSLVHLERRRREIFCDVSPRISATACTNPLYCSASMSTSNKKGFSEAAIVPITSPVGTMAASLNTLWKLLKETEVIISDQRKEQTKYYALNTQLEKENASQRARIAELEKELAALTPAPIPFDGTTAGSGENDRKKLKLLSQEGDQPS
jgi:hypothetical protein